MGENEMKEGKKRMKESVETSAPNPNLPEEIITDILSRLPVKPLLQFRSVSKPWLSLISSPHFTKTHLIKSTQNPKLSNHNLILASRLPHYNLKSLSLCNVLNDPISEAVDLDHPMKSTKPSLEVLDCVNGLVLLMVGHQWLFVWNPSTRKSRRVPSPDECVRFRYYGLGYDKCSDDFKVVAIFTQAYRVWVKVYSLRGGGWRRIEDFPYTPPFEDIKFANGALNVLERRKTDDSSKCVWNIYSIDLERETYGEIMQPSYGEGEYELTMGAVGESLCVVCHYPKIHADVWIMKEYGVRESWTKLVSIPYLHNPLPTSSRYSIPLGISDNGCILVEYKCRLTLFNAEDNTFEKPEILNHGSCSHAFTYIESLVSPL